MSTNFILFFVIESNFHVHGQSFWSLSSLGYGYDKGCICLVSGFLHREFLNTLCINMPEGNKE